MATKTKTKQRALKKGDILRVRNYGSGEYDVKVLGFADRRAKIKVQSIDYAGSLRRGTAPRLLDNDLKKLRKRYVLPA